MLIQWHTVGDDGTEAASVPSGVLIRSFPGDWRNGAHPAITFVPGLAVEAIGEGHELTTIGQSIQRQRENEAKLDEIRRRRARLDGAVQVLRYLVEELGEDHQRVCEAVAELIAQDDADRVAEVLEDNGIPTWWRHAKDPLRAILRCARTGEKSDV